MLEEDFSSSTTETPKLMVYRENCHKRRIERSTKPNKRIFLSLHYEGTWETLGILSHPPFSNTKSLHIVYDTT